jgi:hypothetical protein
MPWHRQERSSRAEVAAVIIPTLEFGVMTRPDENELDERDFSRALTTIFHAAFRR